MAQNNEKWEQQTKDNYYTYNEKTSDQIKAVGIIINKKFKS